MKPSRLKVIAFALCFSVSLFLYFSVSARAEELEERLKKSQEKIEELQRKITETQAKQKTLASAIAFLDNKINLTMAQITQTEEKIALLQNQIAQLNLKIGRLDESLDTISQLLVLRIIETYKTGVVNPLYLFLTSDGFSQFLSRYKYLRIVQTHDRGLLYQMEQTRFNYDTQKTLKKKKQKEIEELKLQLEAQKTNLAQQKKDKEHLLEVTKNDEKRYQQLLAAARAEYEAIEQAMRQAVDLLKDGTPVGKGETIALIGNTGYPHCSTGPHLHFEVRHQDGGLRNPGEYLRDVGIRDECGENKEENCFEKEVEHFVPSGDWDWPITNPRITQEFGMSYWARLGWYNGGPHTGIDMTSDNVAIRAPQDGTLYRGSTSCQGAKMNFVAIEHGDGLISWYWHVQ